MQAFLQSAILQALGHAIANSLWQVALLWIITVLINNIGKQSAAKKYVTAVTAQFAGFIWFAATLRFYYLHAAGTSAGNQFYDLSDAAYILEPAVTDFSSAALYIIVKTEQLFPYLSAAYLFMLLFLCIRLVRAFYFTAEIRKKGLKKAGVDLRLFVKTTAAALGIKKEVHVYFSKLVQSPLTIGFLKPLILIPVASINHLTAEQLEAVLLHELAHIKRADYLINIIQSIIETVLFFNPFVQLLGRQIKHERENSCDDWVLQFQYSPAMYAEALLRIAYIQSGPSLTMNAGGNKGELLPRVKRMLNQQDKNHSYRNQVFSFILITIMLITVAWLQPVVKNTNTGKQQAPAISRQNNRAIAEPLSATVENPLYNPLFFLTAPIQKEIDKAVELAQQHVAQAAPGIEKTVVETVTPVVMEQLQNLSLNLTGALAEMRADEPAAQDNMDENKTDITDHFILNDSINISNFAAPALLNLVTNADWQKINTEINAGLHNAQKELAALGNEKTLNIISKGFLSNVLSKTVLEFEQLKTENIVKKQAQALKQADLQKLQAGRLKEATDKLEKKLLKDRQNKDTEKWIENKLNDIFKAVKEADNNEEDEAVSFSGDAFIEQPYAPEIYAPVAYNYPFNTYSFADSMNIESAVIVVKHNPANEKSHTKHITVEITGNNGQTKSYEFTVEVFQ